MKVKDILRNKGSNVICIDENKTIFDAINVLVTNNIGAAVVINSKGNVVGIISERDILRQSHKNLDKLREIPIEDVMTRDLIVGEPEDELEYVEQVMTENRIRHYPIFENKKLAGIVSIGDVVKYRLSEYTVENRYLRDYIQGKYPA